MGIDEVLRRNRGAIAGRWLEAALSAYPTEALPLFRDQKDPFANPVGHALRTGIQGVLQALADGKDPGEACRHLQEVLSIRAVQDMPASRALAFIFQLKEALRAEVDTGDPNAASGLSALDGRIDGIALAAFDAYLRCRERLYELRINEVKRQVPWAVRRAGRGETDPAPADAPVCGNEEGNP